MEQEEEEEEEKEEKEVEVEEEHGEEKKVEKLGPTVPEKAAWNCVAKQPPDENPLTAIVSRLTES